MKANILLLLAIATIALVTVQLAEAQQFEFIINLKAAKQIGLTIPPNVLARAHRVIR